MVNILGINLTELDSADVLKRCEEMLKGSSRHYLVTPNPEIILAAHVDEELFYILNQADLAPADGFGLKVAARIFGSKLPRTTGADLVVSLLELAESKNIKTAVILWENGLTRPQELKEVLIKRYPSLDCLILESGRDRSPSQKIKEEINRFAPQLIFCALGFPHQEKFIYHNLDNWPSARLALAIGGSFDFISGKRRRAPRLFRHLGLEWLWRLITLPRRLGRIYRATFVFLGKVLRARLINPWLFRPNVACWIYRITANGPEVILVEREDQAGHWQLPQGGLDGQSLKKAGAREAREELGTDKFLFKAAFRNVYKYYFQETRNRNASQRVDSKKYKYDYKGQRQGLFVAEFVGSDSDIKVNFWDHRDWKWVPLAQLEQAAYPTRREGIRAFRQKFESLGIK